MTKALKIDLAEAVVLACENTTYLARLSGLHQPIEATASVGDILNDLEALCCPLSDAGLDTDTTALMAALRCDKARFHWHLALLDLAGALDQAQVTAFLTRFADRCCDGALRYSLSKEGAGRDGLTLFALGKMGAFELNYSSDIDMAAFYDGDVFDGGARDPAEAASRAVREAMRILSERTRDGYVFRTDLRLRPDPSSTPLAVSTRRAELYYESVGQNWERMVWIKGRPAAGDMRVGEAFLKMMEPFVWRRHLDYWAIADVQAIKAMINAKTGHGELADPAPNLKLGPGGIREIEFFVQTQQIILGGRNRALRVRGTLEGLDALVSLGVVEAETAADLALAYDRLRTVEHRIQMLNDEQTHSLPSFEAQRAKVAALTGYSELDDFDAMIERMRRLVHGHYNNLFADEARKRKAANTGNLVFTGVDDDPGTVATLQGLGFSDPAGVIESVRNWHRGRTSATRSARGRELLTALLPDLLSAMGKTRQADEAFRRFSRFFEALRSGVQTLSMLVAEPELMEDLVTTLALAPRIGGELSRRPGLLEALLFESDRKDAPVLTDETDFETAMERFRRWHGERAFIIGHRLLHGQIAAGDAAAEWSDLADTTVRLMAFAAERETARRFGTAPGPWTVAGLGKFGGQDMTAGSDLDLLVIYDAPDPAEAQGWFTKFTQRLITALSAETGEGALYDVDMRLRPSGGAGPVATSHVAFNRYHAESAWTWEHMTLTRLRAITGDRALGQQVESDAARHIVHGGDPAMRATDILDMRARLHRDKPATDDWDLKMRAGGLVDIEFIIQKGLLTAGRDICLPMSLSSAFEWALNIPEMSPKNTLQLRQAHGFLSALQQVQRVAVGAQLDTDGLSDGLKDRLCRATGCRDFPSLKQELERHCVQVREIFREKIGMPATESGA